MNHSISNKCITAVSNNINNKHTTQRILVQTSCFVNSLKPLNTSKNLLSQQTNYNKIVIEVTMVIFNNYY